MQKHMILNIFDKMGKLALSSSPPAYLVLSKFQVCAIFTLTVLRNSATMVLYWSLISLTTLSLRLSALSAAEAISIIIRNTLIIIEPDLKLPS